METQRDRQPSVCPAISKLPQPLLLLRALWLEQRTLGIAAVLRGMYSWCCTIHVFSLGSMTRQLSYSSSLYSPEMLRATMDHQKFTLVPSAQNALPTRKNTKALSYASLAITRSTLTAQHLPTPNNTRTLGPAPNVMLRPHLQSLHL